MALALGRVRFAPLFGPRSAFAFAILQTQSGRRAAAIRTAEAGSPERTSPQAMVRRASHRIWRVSQWLCSLIQEGTGLRVPAVAGPGMTMVN